MYVLQGLKDPSYDLPMHNDKKLIQWEHERSKDYPRLLGTELSTAGRGSNTLPPTLDLIITLTYIDLIIILTEV